MICMGILFRKEREEEILSLSKKGISNAANVFQWNMIEGICANTGEGINIVNSIPVGVWPKSYKKLFLKNETWEYGGKTCYEIGGLNLPFFKQFGRARRARQKIKKLIKDNCEDHIVIYSAYMPYLRAVYKLPRNIKISVVVTDLPEYYDLSATSGFRKFLRARQNKLIDKYMKRVDSFVILTEQMKKPLKIGNRPYTVIEGICNVNTFDKVKSVKNSPEEKIILYTGTLHRIFGVENLLEAFLRIDDPTYKLWICGGGDTKAEIEEAAKNDPRITFYGYVPKEKISELQQKATVLVNPRQNNEEYTKYSFPSKTMEYMLSGKPVVMYKLDGIPDEYDEYLCYVPDNTVDGLKDKLMEICGMSDEEREGLGEKARSFVETEKNSKKQAGRLLELINKK